MLVLERRQRIAQLLEEQGSVRVSALAANYGVTEETIRRDLEDLERAGFLKRTYGGAVAWKGTGYESPYDARRELQLDEKLAIAKKAAELVADGETLFLDASTTTLYLARQLIGRRDLGIITNSIQIVSELGGQKGLTVVATGGKLRDKSLSCVGPLAARVLREYHPDWAFISCKGFSPKRGLLDTNDLEVELKRLALKNANVGVALVDSSKFQKPALLQIGPVESVAKIITDKMETEMQQELASRGVEVLEAC
jgi:DeoR/GlpR family transcriptional regulator of sugar metabolism